MRVIFKDKLGNEIGSYNELPHHPCVGDSIILTERNWVCNKYTLDYDNNEIIITLTGGGIINGEIKSYNQW